MKYLFKVFNAQLCVCIVFFLLVAGCSREPQKAAVPSSPAESKQEQKPEALYPAGREAADKTNLLATIADDEKPQSVFTPMLHGQDGAGLWLSTARKGRCSIAYELHP